MTDTPRLMDQLEQISGIVDKIVFSNEENGFTVAVLAGASNRTDPIHIVGTIPGLQAGEAITCRGNYKHHSSHGRQFEVSSFEVSFPKDLVGIRRYLESGGIRGIGPVYAKKIVDHFGKETLDVIDHRPTRLLEIEGIGKKKLHKIMDHWNEQKKVRDVLVFLRGHGVGNAVAKKIYKKYGENTKEELQKNPYGALQGIFGIGFKTADKLAAELNIPKTAPIRVESGLEYVLRELSDQGHTCYPEEKLFTLAETLLEVDLASLSKAITMLELNDRIVRRELITKEGPLLHVWLKSSFLCETTIAAELNRLVSSPCAIREIKQEKAMEWVEEKHKLRLATEQQKALLQSFTEKVQIITGGPGTGKSTITKAILSIHEKLTERICLAAPTGKAAKRMSEITRKWAKTIHALLEVDFQEGGFKRNKNHPLECDLLIVDEASMIDTHLMFHLLRAIPSTARLIFIGDIDQLPSVGSGNILRDMIESGRIPVTRLNHIFRQGKDSQIVLNAHKINKGEFPYLAEPKEESDFLFLEIEEPGEIVNRMIHLVSEEIPNRYSFDRLGDIQVLSPMKKGTIGIENLNVALQQALNPKGKEVTRFGRIYREQDKVMQIRNNYQKMVFNGDVGRIERIDLDEELVEINFDGKVIEYEISELDEVVLAYAVSVHKYQGSECPCIVMPIHTSHFKLLQKNLLYTAITRSKKLVVLLGTKKAIALAVKNDEVETRYTGLATFITEKLP